MSRQLHHIGFIVKNLEESLAYFEVMYGAKADLPYVFRPTRAWNRGVPVADYALKIAMIPMEGSANIELIEPVSGDGIHRDFIRAGYTGMHHLCYSVTNYDEWREKFLDQGYEISFEAETEDDRFGYRRCFYAYDPAAGMICEIKEEPYFRK